MKNTKPFADQAHDEWKRQNYADAAMMFFSAVIILLVVWAFCCLTGCAEANTGVYQRIQPGHPPLTYRCKLTPWECHLVDSAAYWLNQRGYPTQRDEMFGTVDFVPASQRFAAIHFQRTTIHSYGPDGVAWDLIYKPTPVVTRESGCVFVHAAPGAMRDGDMVALFEQMMQAGR